MAKTLELKLKEFSKTLDRLNEVLQKEKDDIIRDSVIKRFEFCFELCWKTIKLFLREKYGEDIFSPKDCFRSLGKNGIILAQEVEELLKMTDDRNSIIHTYNENSSDELYENIVEKYYALMQVIYKKLIQ